LPTLWHRITDFDTASTIVGWLGADVPTFISAVLSPWFGFAMILAGLVGLPIAKKESEGKSPSRIWTFLGWGAFSACAILLGFGLAWATALYVDEHSERHLTEVETQAIIRTFTPVKSDFKNVQVNAIQEADATGYAVEFIVAFHRLA
jgi:hypothetical protein